MVPWGMKRATEQDDESGRCLQTGFECGEIGGKGTS